MRRHLGFAATALALALIFAGGSARAFKLERKGAAAKWRTDIVKKQNKYTGCVLSAWTKCEKAATKLGGNGFVDCDVSKSPVAAGGSSILLPATSAAIRAAADQALSKCDITIVGTKGLGTANAKAGLTLGDIGCFGDCGTADGAQACTGPTAQTDWEDLYVDPVNNKGNVRNTAVTLGDGIGGLACLGAATACVSGTCAFDPATSCTIQADCAASAVVQKASGTMADNLLGAVVKYIGAATACVQKCQDDFNNKAGNGFDDDATACLISNNLDAGLPGDSNFNGCIAKAAAAFSKLTDANACGWVSTLKPLLAPLLAGSINAATNSAYDKIDLQTAHAVAVVSAGAPPLAPLMSLLSDRSVPGTRASFGATCHSCGNGLLEDAEECDSGANNNVLCGVIPGTIAGPCPTTDSALAGQQACRCPR